MQLQGTLSATGEGGSSGATGIAYDEAPTTKFHVLVAASAAGGQFSDGYVLGTIGIALSSAHEALHLDAVWLGALGAASLAGLFVGSLLLGPLADRFGRRPFFVPTMAIFAIISVLQFFVTTPAQLLTLRLLLGLVLGVDYVVCCTVVAEFSPLRTRGRLLGLLVFSWFIGYTAAFIFGTLLASTLPDAWRWILLSSAVPSAAVFLARMKIPESPLWLVRRGRSDEARKIISRHLGHRVQLPPVLASDAETNGSKRNGTVWSELLSRRYRRRTAVGAVFYTAQVIPFFAISTFVPIVFSSLGIHDAYTSGVVFNVFMLLGAGCGLWVVDMVTRRHFLVWTFYLSAATLLFLVLAANAAPALVISVAALFAFVLTVSTIMENVYLPELFPTRLRASGVGVGTAASRAGSSVATFALPVLVETIGVRPTLGMCVAVLLAGGLFCHAFAPETLGRSMEEV